jgi:hypothetical protein
VSSFGGRAAGNTKYLQFLRKIFQISINPCMEPNVEKIYLSYPERIAINLCDKKVKLSLVDMISELSQNQKELILHILINDDAYHKIINSLSQYSDSDRVIIFTSPFSEDCLLDEGQKKVLFTKLYNEYKEYGKVFIKKHPRDLSIYDIPNAILLEGFFPSEIFNLLNVKFNYAVGICTSAVDNVIAKNKINRGIDSLNDII